MVQQPEFDPVEVCQRIQQGDVAAESELVRRFSESVMFMLQQRTRDPALSEDLHQDTFRIVLERLRSNKSIADPERVSGFIHRTALNVCIDHARKISRRKTYPDSDVCAYAPDPQANQLEQVLEQERIGLVHDIINGLKVDRDRELLHRFYVLEQDKVVICQHFGLSADNFDRVISRARNRFRDAIQKRMRVLNLGEV